MTTTDANGIVFLQDTDNISPFHTLINGLQTATSAAIANTRLGGGITPSTAAAFGSGAYVGQYIDDPVGGLQRWNGTAWRPLGEVVWIGAPALSGTIGTNDLVPDKTIPAGTVAGALQRLRVDASIQCLVAASGGVRLEILVDGSVVRSAVAGNSGAGAANLPIGATWTGLLSATASHTARARIVTVAGSNSATADLGQTFSLSVAPAVAL